MPSQLRSVLAPRPRRIHRVTAAERVIARRKPVILVAVHGGPTSVAALRRADALTRIFGARLVVLHVVETTRARFHAKSDESQDAALLAVRHRIAMWCATTLGARSRAPEVVVRSGRVASVLIELATLRNAMLVVIGAMAERSIAPRLLHGLARPLLVARPPRPVDAIVAATDLADDTYPVLRRAAMLGARLEAPVTFVTTVTERSSRRIEEQSSLLAALARSIGDGISSRVECAPRAVDAILGVARAQDADLLVVGAREASPASARGTADAVVGEARRSVLVVPIARGTEAYP